MASDDELTDAAKAEIAAGIAIVKEDRIMKFLTVQNPPKPADIDPPKPTDPPTDPPKPVDPPKPTDPKPVEPPPPTPPTDPLPPKKGIWWGDQLDDTPPAKT